MTETLAGVVERVTSHSPETGFCVLRVQARGHRDLVTVVGSASQVVAGEYLEASGRWTTHRQFGPQFQADDLRLTPPHTADGIARFLGSGLVKGIGKTYARKIVDVFGDRTLSVIDESPSFLSQVRGIGPKRIEQIRESWHAQKAVRQIMVFLHSCGVGTSRAAKIYKAYGDVAVETVRQNPYRLAADIWGVGFRTADDIARKLGIPPDSPLRAKAAVRHVLSEAAGSGHVGLPVSLTLAQAAELTGIAEERLADAAEELRQADEIVRDAAELAVGQVRVPEGELPADEPLFFLKGMFLAEVGVARGVAPLRGGAPPLHFADLDAAVADAERRMGIDFAPAQRAAVRAAAGEKLLVLTGGPGTGKTTIVRAILELYRSKNRRVALAAPTGRAAKRLAESTGREARTIHRLLEYDAALGGFRRNRENPLELDLLVVDEASMLDVSLANQLLRAVPPGAAVLLVGDVDQLPSVGAGSVLRDVIESGAVPVARLTEVHRQAGASWIVRAAHAIHRGEVPESAPPGGSGDFFTVAAEEPARVVERVLTMVKERIPAKFGLDPLRDIQVLAPMNRGELGVRSLNDALQAALNPPRPGLAEAARYATTFRVGDKILQTRNNYQREVFNGDIGRVAAIDADDEVLLAEFDGREIPYEFSDLDELQLAYAVSVHRSQGSEYPAVVLPLHTQHYVMLQRNLLYTAVTRGRKLVVVAGSPYALRKACENGESGRRWGLLRWRLRGLGATAG